MSTTAKTNRSSARPLALASVVCLLGAARAMAADPGSTQHSMLVRYGDLNLSSLAGATTLYQRISGAARSICGDSGHGLFEQRMWNDCFSSAVANAVATVNNPLLTGIYRHERPADETAMLTR
jgi:UrcA family protein